MLQGIEDGYFQAEIADAAYRYQRLVEQGRKVVVGVNRFQRPAREGEINVLQIPRAGRPPDRGPPCPQGRAGRRAVREALAGPRGRRGGPGGASTGGATSCGP